MAQAVPDALVPKQARSQQTQNRIVDAAVAVLTDSGYEGFTTATVSRRAGVSKGALFQHFPTRERLVAVTAERIMERQRERFRRRLAAADRAINRERARRAIRLLWRLLREPEYLACLQVYGAAQQNQLLAAALRPIALEQAEKTDALSDEFLNDVGVPSGGGRTGLKHVLFYTLEGMAEGAALSGTAEEEAQVFEYLERLVLDAARPRTRRNQ